MLPVPKVRRLTLTPTDVQITVRVWISPVVPLIRRRVMPNSQRCGAIQTSIPGRVLFITLVLSRIQPVGGRLGTLFALEQNLDQTWQKHCKSELGLHPSILFPVISSSSAIDQTEYQFITDFEVREPV